MEERNAGELRHPAHKEGFAAREKPAHRPWLAMGLSILFAGLGQLYNRSYIKGIITFADFIGLVDDSGNNVSMMASEDMRKRQN